MNRNQKNSRKTGGRMRILAILLAVLLAVGLIALAARSLNRDAVDTLLGILSDYLEIELPVQTQSPADVLPTDTASPPPEPPLQTGAEPETEAPPPLQSDTETEAAEPPAGVVRGTYYYSTEDVALYLHTFGVLPDNYITKKEAETLGWDSSKGNLWDVAEGFCIGGDRFGNYEGLLPKKGSYQEADVNYTGGYRGADRLIFDTNGNIWYTGDHYKSFRKLY